MSSTSLVEPVLTKYTPLPGCWDEAVRPSGQPRRHWRKLYAEVARLGIQQLNRRWQAGQQLIQSQGVTYNRRDMLPLEVTGGGVMTQSQSQGVTHNRRDRSESEEHSWPMDPIPLVIDEKEWTAIETAVVQRATLLNALLADLYGPQRMLRERLVPSTVVFANPYFLRPCFGIVPAGGIHLQTYAVDLSRGPDGRWMALADRTQAPSGMGYTLQNRLVSARTLPGVFSQYRVRQLARFFDVKREALLSLAGTGRSNPTVALLSPGPRNETYFEHSFLAGQWGINLVEGGDLVVLDRRVYMRTLGGLKPVDLILRRLDDTYCDPLELRGDSLLGVAGLLDAARSGSVIVDNAFGSGAIETPAFMAFLPELCRRFLGEELAMPSVATWWCGDEESRRRVLSDLRGLVLKPTFQRAGRAPEFPDSMDAAGIENLAKRIEVHSEGFVAQDRLALSTAPVRTEDGFAPRHMTLRAYAVWNGSSYSVMPGGLTRVSKSDSSLIVSMHLGGGSKDTWILGEEESAPARRQLALPLAVSAANRDLPSRVADNLFWLGRYTERVEAGIRLVRVLLPALSGEEDYGRAVSLETATRLLVGLGYLSPGTAEASLGEQRWQVQRTLTEMIYDTSQSSSLRWNLKEMRRSSWHLKERLSGDTWRVLQQLETQFSGFVPATAEHRVLAGMDLLDSAIVTLSAFAGLLTENTTRGFGWRFLEIGRRMERALQTADLIGATFAAAEAHPEPYLQVLLQIADSSITYRTRYPTALQPELVLDVLWADESNPRAMAFQLGSLGWRVRDLDALGDANRDNVRLKAALDVLAAIRTAPLTAVAQRDADGRFVALDDCTERLRTALYELSEVLTAAYLSPVRTSRLTAYR